jgi:hypothetical protein
MDITNQAETNDLGPIVEHHGYRTGANLFLASGCITFGLFVAIGFVQSIRVGGGDVAVYFLPFFALIFIYLGIDKIKHFQIDRRNYLTVHTQGFAYHKKGVSGQIRWDEIDELQHGEKIVKGRYGIYVSGEWIIRSYPNVEIRPAHLVHGHLTFMTMIQRKMSNLMVEPMIEDLASGKELTFGELTISNQGLSNEGTILSWEDVADVEIYQLPEEFAARGAVVEFIAINKFGGDDYWAIPPAAGVPNYFLAPHVCNAYTFYREVARSQKIWTFLEGEKYPTYRIIDQGMFVPLWSSQARLEIGITNNENVSSYIPEPYQLDWEEFCTDLMPWLEDNDFFIRPNWNGNLASEFDDFALRFVKMIQYDPPPAVIRKSVEREMALQSGSA